MFHCSWAVMMLQTMVTVLCECQQSRLPKMAEPRLHRIQETIVEYEIKYKALKNASEPNTTHKVCDLTAEFGFDSIRFKTEISLNFFCFTPISDLDIQS